MTNTAHAETFAKLLNEKFADSKYISNFHVQPGRKYHRIAYDSPNQRFVHAFVDNEGNVYKAAGWKAPAKGARFADVETAAANADEFGSYLYLR